MTTEPSARRVSDAQLDHLRLHGYVVIPGFLTDEEVAAGQQALALRYPTAEEFAANPEAHAWLSQGQFAGLLDFPFEGSALNNHSTSPAVIDFMERALGVRDIQMIQSRSWAKYGSAVSYDQDHHQDLLNHTLAYPRDDTGWGEIEAFIYYSDVDEASGATRLVSRTLTDSFPPEVFALDRSAYPEIYEAEVAACGPAGTMIAYTPLTFHRGAAFTDVTATRQILGIAYVPSGQPWTGHQAWAYAGAKAEMKRFLEGATPRQREVLGFPPPGHAYWNARTLAGVAARFPGMDLEPYRRAAPVPAAS